MSDKVFAPSKGSHQESMPPTLKGLIKDFGENTSMHGMGKAMGGNSSSWFRKLVWVLLVMAAAGMAITNLIVVVREFLTFPTSTELSVEYRPKVTFPAVTICNLNRVRRSRLPEDVKDALDALIKNGHTVLTQNKNLDLFLRENPDDLLIEMGHSLNQMLIECHFDLRPCYAENFSVSFNMAIGNCYTYNSRNGRRALENTKVVGPANGLIMELDIQQNDYLPMTPGAGFKVMVHPPETIGFPEEAGVQAAPGFSTSIGLKRVEIERTPSPYGDCIKAREVDKNPAMNIFEDYDVSYSDPLCKKSCYQIEVFKRCKCCDPGYPCQKSLLQHISTNMTSILHCSTSKDYESRSTCLLDVQDRYLRGDLPCISDCKPACFEAEFKQTVSSSRWPSDAFGENMLNKIKLLALDMNLTLDASNASVEVADFVKKNLLRIEIFYEQINCEKIKIIPAYDWYRLLSDIGGQLGLWMGFSLMTGIEILEFIVDLFILFFHRVFGRRPKTSQDPVTELTISGMG